MVKVDELDHIHAIAHILQDACPDGIGEQCGNPFLDDAVLQKHIHISALIEDLADYIEIAHADPYVPSIPLSKVVKEELPDNINRRIFVFERASQMELLAKVKDSFMWVSPVPEENLKRYGLVEKKCDITDKTHGPFLRLPERSCGNLRD